MCRVVREESELDGECWFVARRRRSRNHPVTNGELLWPTRVEPVVARCEGRAKQFEVLIARSRLHFQQLPATVVGLDAKGSMFGGVHHEIV